MRKVFRIVGIVLGVWVGVALLTGVGLYFIGDARLNKTYDVSPSNITLPKLSQYTE